MEGRAAFAVYLPPLWFLGLYETLAMGAAAPSAAWPLAVIGLYTTAAVALLTLITYPLAWSRQKKRALEGASQARGQIAQDSRHPASKTILKRPQQRAIFHFLSQTIARNPRYQIYLALYSGAGLALALCTTISVRQSANHALTPTLWQPGLHAVLPLLLFWMVAGLRGSFAFPVDILARWVFPMNLLLAEAGSSPTAFPGPDAKAAKTWTLLCSSALIGIVLSILLIHWSWTPASCSSRPSMPPERLATPARRPLLRWPHPDPLPPACASQASPRWPVFLYVVFFPTVTALTVHFELTAEIRLKLLGWILVGIPALHLRPEKDRPPLAQARHHRRLPRRRNRRGPLTLEASHQ